LDTPIVVAIVSAAASILVAAITFFLTKRKEREADWRKQKLEHYRALLEAMSGIVGSDVTPNSQRQFARACNTIILVASQPVLQALCELQDEISITNQTRSTERHDHLLNKLLFSIRADLEVAPADEPTSLNFRLWQSGADRNAS
jgi:hypothetical protein